MPSNTRSKGGSACSTTTSLPVSKPEEEEDEDEAAYQAALAAALATSIEEERLKAEAEEADYQARLVEAIALSAIGDCVVPPSSPPLFFGLGIRNRRFFKTLDLFFFIR